MLVPKDESLQGGLNGPLIKTHQSPNFDIFCAPLDVYDNHGTVNNRRFMSVYTDSLYRKGIDAGVGGTAWFEDFYCGGELFKLLPDDYIKRFSTGNRITASSTDELTTSILPSIVYRLYQLQPGQFGRRSLPNDLAIGELHELTHVWTNLPWPNGPLSLEYDAFPSTELAKKYVDFIEQFDVDKRVKETHKFSLTDRGNILRRYYGEVEAYLTEGLGLRYRIQEGLETGPFSFDCWTSLSTSWKRFVKDEGKNFEGDLISKNMYGMLVAKAIHEGMGNNFEEIHQILARLTGDQHEARKRRNLQLNN